MFGGVTQFSPITHDQRFGALAVPVEAAYPAYERLVAAVAACQRVRIVRDNPAPDVIAYMIWSLLHGLVSLEFAGYVRPASLAAKRNLAATNAFLKGLAPGPT
jgi:hypothetical protein